MRRSDVALRAIIMAVAFIVFRPEPSLGEAYQFTARKIEPPQPIAEFTLTGPDGKPYSLESLRGKFVLLAFGFTHCPNVCPTTLANLAAASDLLLPAERKRVQVLFITIDPTRDTPAVLRDYVPFFDEHFIGLTGKPDEIAAVTKAFGVEYEKTRDWGGGDANYTMDHTAGAMILAPTGEWIGAYGSGQLTQSQRVAADLRHFIALANAGVGEWQSQKLGPIRTPQLSARGLYLRECALCHGENGTGVSGKYPALAHSNWVTGPPNRLTALVLGGLRATKDGDRGVMPAWWRILPPGDVAKILTYIRQAWGNNAPAISPAYARELAYRYAKRPGFWSWKELNALPAEKDSAAEGL